MPDMPHGPHTPSVRPQPHVTPPTAANPPLLPRTRRPPNPPNPSILQGHVTCETDALIRPNTTEELAAAIAAVNKRAGTEGRTLKMRATRDGFASMASFPCSYQPSDPSAPISQQLRVGILMDDMNKLLSVNKANHQMRVQAQMQLHDLYQAATANEMSIPRSSLPWWQGLTLGGIVSTTSHGSGHNVTSMIVSSCLMRRGGPAVGRQKHLRFVCIPVVLVGLGFKTLNPGALRWGHPGSGDSKQQKSVRRQGESAGASGRT